MTARQNRAMLDRDDVILDALHAVDDPPPTRNDPAVGTWNLGTYAVPTFRLADLVGAPTVTINAE